MRILGNAEMRIFADTLHPAPPHLSATRLPGAGALRGENGWKIGR